LATTISRDFLPFFPKSFFKNLIEMKSLKVVNTNDKLILQGSVVAGNMLSQTIVDITLSKAEEKRWLIEIGALNLVAEINTE
jgi:hypothetical protein